MAPTLSKRTGSGSRDRCHSSEEGHSLAFDCHGTFLTCGSACWRWTHGSLDRADPAMRHLSPRDCYQVSAVFLVSCCWVSLASRSVLPLRGLEGPEATSMLLTGGLEQFSTRKRSGGLSLGM